MTVLDAYAVIAYLRGEDAAAEVAQMLRGDATLSAANAAEVVDQLVRIWGRDGDDVEGDLALLGHAGMWIHPLDAELALHAGRLRARHHHRKDCAVSLADCVAAATSLRLGTGLATSDPALAAVVRAEGGNVTGLPDSAGRRPGRGIPARRPQWARSPERARSSDAEVPSSPRASACSR